MVRLTGRTRLLLLRNHQLDNVARKHFFAAPLQELFAGLVDGCQTALEIVRINHVIGVFKQVQVTLLQGGFQLRE